jgi:hypothetical protein
MTVQLVRYRRQQRITCVIARLLTIFPLSFQFLLPFPFLVLPCSALPVTVLPYRVETRQSHAI